MRNSKSKRFTVFSLLIIKKRGNEKMKNIEEKILMTDNNNAYLEKYIESYQLLKEKNINSLSELKESITDLRDKN